MYYNKQSTRIYKKIVRISQNNLLEFFAYLAYMNGLTRVNLEIYPIGKDTY